jgi:acetyltransferase
MALVAVSREQRVDVEGEVTEVARIVGVSRYISNPDRTSCEFSLVVADDFSGKGLGSRLMLSIMEVAREKGLTEIEGLVLAKNPTMLKLMKGLGFAIKPFPDDPDFKLVTQLL